MRSVYRNAAKFLENKRRACAGVARGLPARLPI